MLFNGETSVVSQRYFVATVWSRHCCLKDFASFSHVRSRIFLLHLIPALHSLLFCTTPLTSTFFGGSSTSIIPGSSYIIYLRVLPGFLSLLWSSSFRSLRFPSILFSDATHLFFLVTFPSHSILSALFHSCLFYYAIIFQLFVLISSFFFFSRIFFFCLVCSNFLC